MTWYLNEILYNDLHHFDIIEGFYLAKRHHNSMVHSLLYMLRDVKRS